jgi:sn-glycerol 3-phosphate transport system substrate-binding protein
MRPWRSWALLAAATCAGALGVTALGTVTPAVARAGTTVDSGARPRCALSALARHRGTVDITFWNSAAGANQAVLQSIADSFNASQTKVHVALVTQASYDDTWQKYLAGLSDGQLPDAVQLEAQRTQAALDTHSFLPVQSCLQAAGASTSDFLSRPLAYWKVAGVQWALPFAVSAPVLYYNENAFAKAGLDPRTPPATLAQMVRDAQALTASGSGTGLEIDPWHFEAWLAGANQLFVNHDNGRRARATGAVFDSKAAVGVFGDLDQMVRSGDATTNPYLGPDEFDDLLGIGSGKYGMTIQTSAALGTVTALLGAGQYAGVKLGVAPFPVYRGGGGSGVEPDGSGVYISNRVPALEQAASWVFLSYLTDTRSQATWAAGTGYIPVRASAAATATVRHQWAAQPGYQVAYDEITDGSATAATSGSVIGPYEDVRTDIVNAENSMFTGGVSPAAAVRSAQEAADASMADYDSRLGSS